ncbi:hypothetical protein KR032_006047, partial [Drosophila birchii]
LKGSIVAAMALLLACAAPATANVNVTALCLLVNNGVYVASQTDCSTYYQCLGSGPTAMSCPTGYYFDKNAQQCSGTVPSTCTLSSNPCQGKAVGTFAPSSSSCGGYFYCGASGAVSGRCPSGENFNPTTMACVYSNQYPCQDSVATESGSGGTVTSSVALNLCNLVENGIYFGSPTSCSGWNYCQDNVLHSGTCETGKYFNVQQKNCGYQQSTTCSQVTNDPSLTGVTIPTTCTKAGTFKAATACNQYYYCTASLNYQLMTCQTGYFYDTISQLCVVRTQARNDCDRCVGTSASFVNAYSTSNCSDYLYCVNGVQKAVETCPINYYFNENTGSCSNSVEPQFLCCNPTGSTGQATTSATTAATTSATTAATTAGTTA